MDKKFIEKARIELREEEFRKVQSLTQFRDWLSKHPFLSGVRQGEHDLQNWLRFRYASEHPILF